MASVDNQYIAEERSQAFVDHRTGTLVALAGPGTGKTYSLILRIRELVQHQHVPAEDICYLTFIRGIAIAFRSDLQIKYPAPAEVEHLRINTIHSLALRIVRNTGAAISLPGPLHLMNFSDETDPLADFAQSDFISLVGDSTGIHSKPSLRLSFLDIKIEWQNSRSPAVLPGNKRLLWDSYIRYSRAFHVLDWDELIPLASSIHSNIALRPNWLNSLKHVLIDEFQDFNPSEQDFLSALCSHSLSTVIVGDPDQSIYKGRGASPLGIQSQSSNANNTSVSLVICRRCQANIVNAANSFLSYMNPSPRLLRPHQPDGNISLKSFKSCKAEADYLAGRLASILAGITSQTVPEEKPICLFPSKRVLSQYKKELEKRGIKCNARDPRGALDEKTWLRICARVAVQRDQLYLHRILLHRFPKLRKWANEIVNLIVGGCPSVRDALSLLAQHPQWGRESQAGAKNYLSLIDQLISRDADLVLVAFNSVLTGTNQCTKSMVEAYLNTADEVNLEDHIDILASHVFPPTHNGAQYQAELELLTMHSSKGLTRRWVFIPGFEHAWMPHNAIGARLEELKRVFFVAITRATHEVCVSYPRTRARKDTLNFPIAGKDNGPLSPII